MCCSFKTCVESIGRRTQTRTLTIGRRTQTRTLIRCVLSKEIRPAPVYIQKRLLQTSDDKTASNAYEITSDQWTSYVKFRPQYPPQLFQRIYNFHRSDGGRFDKAHDAGCGPGVAAAILAHTFKTVICSDTSHQAIESAQCSLKLLGMGTRCRFQQSAAEDMSWLDSKSVDLVTMSACLHWTDISKTTRAINRTLRPGGTFAAWYYGNVQFPDHCEVNTIVQQTISAWCKLRAAYSQESHRTLWVENTGYDCVALPESEGWAPGVQRTKFNADNGKFSWVRDPDQTEMQLPPQIGPEDVLRYVDDATEWQHDADLDWFKGYFESIFPKLEDIYLTSQLHKIQAAFGQGGKTRAVWPLSLILASKFQSIT